MMMLNVDNGAVVHHDVSAGGHTKILPSLVTSLLWVPKYSLGRIVIMSVMRPMVLPDETSYIDIDT